MAITQGQGIGASGTHFDDVLKIDYLPAVRKQLPDSTILLNRVKQRQEDFSGKIAHVALHTGRNYAIGARPERGTLPGRVDTANLDAVYRQQYDSATFSPSFMYGCLSVTGPVIRASRNNKGAYLKAVDAEMRGLARDLKVSVNRQLYRNGSGSLTGITSASSGAITFTVNSQQYLKPGMAIDIIDATDGAVLDSGGTERVVDSVSAANLVTLSAAGNVDVDTGDYVVSTGTQNIDLWGLEAIVNTANPTRGHFGGIDRTANSFWQGSEVDGGGTALTLDEMEQAIDQADINGEGDVGLIVTSHALKRKYANILTENKRYPPSGETILDGGFRGLEYDGVPLVADRDAGLSSMATTTADNFMYFLDLDTFMFLTQSDWEWMEDGAILSRVDGKDMYEATMYRYFQFACDQPNANVKLHNFS